MIKIVKYCTICEESFAEKFSFCPNCASALTAYEMNPVNDQSIITELPEAAAANHYQDLDESSPPVSPPISPGNYNDGGYRVSIVEDKNSPIRNSLLLGAFVVVMLGTFSGIIISIFTTSLNIDAINDDSVIAYLPPTNAEPVDDLHMPPSVKKHGGGGSGGDSDPNPASKGKDAKMTEDPLISPSVKMDPMTDPLKIQPSVKGPEIPYKEDKTQPYGVKNSPFTIPSDGPGSGGGQGPGSRGGQGNGDGPGIGPGSDGGRGGGKGGGIGPGDGPGIGGPQTDSNDPPPTVKRITANLQILSKPKALYTDAARQNTVQGTVTLRVTFLANGTIGSIIPVSGLPNGLTEQAIAAAHSIKFEPQKVNGVAQTVTKQVQYTFTLF